MSSAEPSEAIDALEDEGLEVAEGEFMEIFNAWVLSACDASVVLGHTISDDLRLKVRPNYAGYGMQKDWKFSTVIKDIILRSPTATREPMSMPTSIVVVLLKISTGDEHLAPFFEYLNSFTIANDDILVPAHATATLYWYPPMVCGDHRET